MNDSVAKKSKGFTITIGILAFLQFVVDGLMFFVFFTSMDFIRNIFTKHVYWQNLFNSISDNETYILVGTLLGVNLLLLVAFFLLKVLKKFPPTITIVVLGINCFGAIVIKTIFYIFEKSNLFFDCEYLNFFTLATSILATVFIVYDFIDYYKGTYRTSQANTTLPTEDVVRETIDVIAKRAKDVTLRIEREDTVENLSKEKAKSNLSAYRTNEGYFNNDALEIAANNMINKQHK